VPAAPTRGAGLPDGQAWYEAWSAVGDEVAAQASADEAAGRLISAGHKHRRACVYHILAERYLDNTDERKAGAYQAMRKEFAAFVACAGEPAEYVEVPYGDTSLPALFVSVGARSRPRPSSTSTSTASTRSRRSCIYAAESRPGCAGCQCS